VTADVRNVLAGVSALGTSGFELAWVADTPGAVLPTDAVTALDTSFQSVGIVTADGVTGSNSIASTDIDAYGSFQPVRTLITGEVRTFAFTGEETNPVTLALKSRQKLADVTATAGGEVAITEGPARDTLYALVFHAIDGLNVIRKVVPSVRVTALSDEQIAKAANVAYGFTCTAYPDTNGVTVYSYYLLNGFGAS
jgi:hypothetical protein